MPAGVALAHDRAAVGQQRQAGGHGQPGGDDVGVAGLLLAGTGLGGPARGRRGRRRGGARPPAARPRAAAGRGRRLVAVGPHPASSSAVASSAPAAPAACPPQYVRGVGRRCVAPSLGAREPNRWSARRGARRPGPFPRPGCRRRGGLPAGARPPLVGPRRPDRRRRRRSKVWVRGPAERTSPTASSSPRCPTCASSSCSAPVPSASPAGCPRASPCATPAVRTPRRRRSGPWPPRSPPSAGCRSSSASRRPGRWTPRTHASLVGASVLDRRRG